MKHSAVVLVYVVIATAICSHPTEAFVANPSSSCRLDSSVLGVTASDKSQLAQLAGMTTLSIDSGDLKVIEDYAKTGYITDATTNPLFVSQVRVRPSSCVRCPIETKQLTLHTSFITRPVSRAIQSMPSLSTMLLTLLYL